MTERSVTHIPGYVYASVFGVGAIVIATWALIFVWRIT